jgi:ClpX C4-type zinc finger protein
MTLPKKQKYRRRRIRARIPTPSPGTEKILAQALAEYKDRVLCCSFCGKAQNEVKKLITGADALVCNECIDRFNEIIADDEQRQNDL